MLSLNSSLSYSSSILGDRLAAYSYSFSGGVEVTSSFLGSYSSFGYFLNLFQKELFSLSSFTFFSYSFFLMMSFLFFYPFSIVIDFLPFTVGIQR